MKPVLLAFLLGACLACMSSSGPRKPPAPSAGSQKSQRPLFLSAIDQTGVVDNVSSTTRAVSGINWSSWFIQEPDGSRNHSLSDYTSAWFYTDGAYQAFMDPKVGKTTPGSKHPRSELHETSLWTSSGTNTLSVTGRVTKIGSGPICIGQVFCNDSTNGGHTLAELGYKTSGFSVYIEESKGGVSSSHRIGGAIGLSSSFSYKMAFSSGKLTITANGQTYTYTPGSAGQDGHFYFKCGNYDQSATSGSISETPYSIFEASDISISHS